MKREESYIEKGTGLANVSLLDPPEGRTSYLELGTAAAHDLGLEAVVAAFASKRGHQKEIWDLFSQLPCDPQAIAYRQAVLEDLLANPAIVERFASLFPVIDSLYGYTYRPEREMTWLHEVVWRAGELQNIIDCLEGISEILGSVEDRIQSDGLRTLYEKIRTIRNDPTYQRLVRELPGVLAQLQAKASITIGVNLDASLRPIQAVLLAVNEKPFSDQSLLSRLFGTRTDREGIAPLHSVPPPGMGGPSGPVDPLMVPLFADLANVLEKTAIPIVDRLRHYTGLHGGLFTNLHQGLVFYLGAVRFIRRFQTLGLPMCRPQIAPAEERRCEVTDSYNVHLLLKHAEADNGKGPVVVTNDIHMGPDGHILILTGPNGGGKTTSMQGVGIVQILAQAGCYVPGMQAVVSPVDHIFTHFPLEEKPESDAGRFGEEAIRLGEIFGQVTRHSLVLLNESLSSTSFSESLYLAQDLVRILRRVGARAVYSTHLHELAERVDELNDSVPGDSRIVSVVSSPVETDSQTAGAEGTRSYRLEVRPPLGQSYAREIASQYGISYQQLEDVLSRRGII